MGGNREKSILAVDTSFLWISVAYYERGKIRGAIHLKEFKHLEMLNLLVSKFVDFDKNPPNILLINLGPGFFTSLRVSASFAKALYLSKGIPMLGFNTLQSMLVGLDDGKYIAYLDARKGEIYAQTFQVKGGIPYEDGVIELGIYKPDVLNLEGYKPYTGYIRAHSLFILFFKGFGKELDENFTPVYLRPPDAIINLATPKAPSNP
ncbi:MAG: tRNA (adenosine(37)-N6)-threonylcarbamoyltransferase complex dimerization subunit type 1 TsaB [candidate division WOR-3 bacterium]